MKPYETLYNLAESINTSWSEREAVDWSEAEQLVSLCREIDNIKELPDINSIVEYAASNDEWDSGVVANWPDIIITELESVDKQYTYRETGDKWEVYGIYLTGAEDWVASVETETVASNLVEMMNNSAPAHAAIQSTADILLELVSDIQATGGLIEQANGEFAPVADKDWIDLGSTVKKAYDWLLAYRFQADLNITSPDS